MNVSKEDIRTQSMTTTLTCKLTTPELRERKATVIASLKGLVKERTELESGFLYQFEGSDENLDRLIDFIKTERICCDFFTFDLKIRRDSAFLKITGPPGAKDFLKNEVQL